MSNFEKHIKSLTESVQLSAHEKDGMREKLQAYMEHVPVYGAAPQRVRPAYLHTLLEYRLVATFAVAVLLITSGGGVVVAARGTLPGDTLYGVKLASENVRGEFFFDDYAQAQWELERVHRRLTDTSILESRNILSREREAVALSAVSDAGERFQEKVAAVEKEQPAAAAALRIAFDARTLPEGAPTATLAYASSLNEAAAPTAMMADSAPRGAGTGGAIEEDVQSAPPGGEAMMLMSVATDGDDAAASMSSMPVQNEESETMAMRSAPVTQEADMTYTTMQKAAPAPEVDEALFMELSKVFENERALLEEEIQNADSVQAALLSRVRALDEQYETLQDAYKAGSQLWAQGQLQSALREVFQIRTKVSIR